MRLLTERSITIDCSADAAYRYASNLERFGEWFPGVIRIASANGLAHGDVGKEYVETVAVPFGAKREVRITVKEARVGELFATEGTFAPLLPRMEIHFRATGATTCEVTWRMFSRKEGAVTRFVVLPLASREITKRATRAMTRLKANLETAAGS